MPRMPAIISGIVRQAVNHHINLNVAEQLRGYTGPVTLVRRLRDEMITTRMLELDTNRGNNLLVDLLTHRRDSIL